MSNRKQLVPIAKTAKALKQGSISSFFGTNALKLDDGSSRDPTLDNGNDTAVEATAGGSSSSRKRPASKVLSDPVVFKRTQMPSTRPQNAPTAVEKKDIPLPTRRLVRKIAPLDDEDDEYDMEEDKKDENMDENNDIKNDFNIDEDKDKDGDKDEDGDKDAVDDENKNENKNESKDENKDKGDDKDEDENKIESKNENKDENKDCDEVEDKDENKDFDEVEDKDDDENENVKAVGDDCNACESMNKGAMDLLPDKTELVHLDQDEPHLKDRTSRKESLAPSFICSSVSWTKAQPVPYGFLADAFAKVESITGRLLIQAVLVDLFQKVLEKTPDDLLPVVYLCTNSLAAAHDGIEIGVGEGILMKALSQTMGLSLPTLKAKYKEAGDLGDVAFSVRTTQKTMFPPPPLTVRKVFDELHQIAESSGKASQDVKRSKILKLLVASKSPNEAKFITRALLGKLRIHLADKTVIIALASAFTLEKLGVGPDVLLAADGQKKTQLSKSEAKVESKVKEASDRLSSIYNQLPVWDTIVGALLEFREVNDELANACKFKPGIPVSPMLAKPTKAISDVLDRFAESAFTCEFKYDGERAQIHRLSDGTIRIYSRNAENLTPKYPDLVRVLSTTLQDEFKDASFVLDSEAVAFDPVKKQILPFQELQSRKRKDVDEAQVKVRICVFAFDLLFFNDESLLHQPLAKRREHLHSSFRPIEGTFEFAVGHDSRDPEAIMDLLNDSIQAGCEGLMVKALEGPNSTYEPANRSQNWLKVKKDYLEGLGDTLDLVPIGGYVGRGKRTGSFGGFLLACYDPESEEFQSVCKIGTGFSDEALRELSDFYNNHDDRVIDCPLSYYRTSAKMQPDVWFNPCQVWEVKCADLSISPAHTAAIGLVDPEKGIALRFPRFIRVRDDKKPDDATTSEQVAEFYRSQASTAG